MEIQPVPRAECLRFRTRADLPRQNKSHRGSVGSLEGQVRAQRPFVLVVGASGSGKSSLVRAGVLPLLTQPETIEGIGLWRWSVTRPGAGGSGGDCFDALAAALLEPFALPALANPESLGAIRDFASELREHSDSVALRVRDALDHAAREWKIRELPFAGGKKRQLRALGKIGRRRLCSTAEGMVRATETPFGFGC